MSATAVMTEAVVVMVPHAETVTMACHQEVESASCECCGLTEECTNAYIQRIRERHSGKWICGLCSEAVKDEIFRSLDDRMISTEEALARHMAFCKKFSSPPVNSAVLLISAMSRLLKRGLESRSVPGSPVKKNDRTAMIRSESCVAAMALRRFDDVE